MLKLPISEILPIDSTPIVTVSTLLILPTKYSTLYLFLLENLCYQPRFLPFHFLNHVTTKDFHSDSYDHYLPLDRPFHCNKLFL